MKFTRHAWGVFKRLPDPAYRGRGAERLISTHKSSIAAQTHCYRGEHFRRLSKAERNPQCRRPR